MSIRPSSRQIVLFVFLVLAALLIAACNTEPPDPAPEEPAVPPTEEVIVTQVIEVTKEPQISMQPPESGSLCEDLSGISFQLPKYPAEPDPIYQSITDMAYRPGYIIVIGDANDIDTVIAKLDDTLSRPEEDSHRIDLGPFPDVAGLPWLGAEPIMDLYAYEPSAISDFELSTNSIWDVIWEFHQTAVTLKDEEMITNIPYAEPNYLMAAPWNVEGSPFGPGEATVSSDGFSAYRGEAIHVADFVDNGVIRALEGTGGLIVLFDTSPFSDSNLYTLFLPDTGDEPIADLDLCVLHPVADYPDAYAGDVRQHGLFTAGLAHVMAPEAPLYLSRVLDDDGVGDLYALTKVMLLTMLEMCSDDSGKCTEGLGGTVFNLSLGFRPEDAIHPNTQADADQYTELQAFFAQLWAAVSSTPPVQEVETYNPVPVPVVSLYVATMIAKDLGVEIVAATGNDSYPDPENPLPPQHPAIWDHVVAVGSLNDAGERSCYSNTASILMPGGDGESASSCVPSHDVCSAGSTCPFGVASLVLTGSGYGYAHWVGTSFATPLYSGLISR